MCPHASSASELRKAGAMRWEVMRNNRSKPFHWQSENIANAALGSDHAWRMYQFQFASPQPQDLNVDAPIENICMNSRRLQQMFPRERLLRYFEKRHQQGILAFAQRDLCLIGIYKSPATTLEPPATESVAASLRIVGPGGARHPPSAQNGTSACEQFPGTKGLNDIIVRTEFEANDTIKFVGALASHDDRDI